MIEGVDNVFLGGESERSNGCAETDCGGNRRIEVAATRSVKVGAEIGADWFNTPTRARTQFRGSKVF